MSSVSEISALELPSTPSGEAVRAYLHAMVTRDFSHAEQFFSTDTVYNDAMYPSEGLKAVQESLDDYAKQYLTTYRVEAVNQAGDVDTYMVLCSIALKGSEIEMPVCDLIRVREGKIHRIDNCFDKQKLKRLYA